MEENSNGTMRAVICTSPGPISVLKIQNVPLPEPKEGEVLIKILGFGINRAEMFTRQGHSPGLVFPRIIGIECVGVVAGLPSGTRSSGFSIGTKVATCMGGLGRQIPGSYAEFTCVSESNLLEIPSTSLSPGQLAALPEMLQTTWGSLTSGLQLNPGESLLIRGSTSSIGLCAIQLARKLGATRIGATTRRADREPIFRSAGAEEVYIDNGLVAEQISKSSNGFFNKVLELVGTSTLKDSLRCAVPGGLVCMSGIQGGEWTLENFYPINDLPNRTKLCGYSGEVEDFLALPLEELIRDIEEGRVKIPYTEFKLEDIQKVHQILELGGGGSKLVILNNHAF